ncbi:MAG: SH3 domain-containing protein [Anaerolineae bacterium]|nr:SH3 domain-containing protein [Anaerolineae bacterium]
MNPISRLKYALSISVILVAALVGAAIPVMSGGRPSLKAAPTPVVRLPTPTPTATMTPTPTPFLTLATPTPELTATPTSAPTSTPTNTPTVLSTVAMTSTMPVGASTPQSIAPRTTVTTTHPITLEITYKSVRVRGGPDTSYPVVGAVVAGETFNVTGRNADGTWWQICCLAGNHSGWVFNELVTLHGDIQSVPIVEVTPPSSTPVPQP